MWIQAIATILPQVQQHYVGEVDRRIIVIGC